MQVSISKSFVCMEEMICLYIQVTAVLKDTFLILYIKNCLILKLDETLCLIIIG
jgi:hypothetical protein